MRALSALLAAALAVPTLAAVDVPARGDLAGEDANATLRSGTLVVEVDRDPFVLRVVQGGEPVLETVPVPAVPAPAVQSDLPEVPDAAPYGPLSFALGDGGSVHQLGYGSHAEVDLAWVHATRVTELAEERPGRLDLTLATDAPDGRTIALTIEARPDATVAFEATPSDLTGVVATAASFRTDPEQHFLGFGERSDRVDQAGHEVVTWNEEGPFSSGDLGVATDPVFGDAWQGPGFFPGTNFAMPWMLSSRGYGFLLDSDWLNGFELGSDRADAWRVTTREPVLRARVYGGPRPADALRRFTADTGRQPEPAEWFFGPWVQPGPDAAWFADNDVPITVAQTYTHYLPCAAQEGQREAERERVQRWHDQGIRVTTYVNSFVCNRHPQGAYDEGDGSGYFIRSPRTGNTYPAPYVAYLKEDGQYHGIVDFTSEAATGFWQDLVSEALEDGYDGWMEDFGEYVPADAVTSDGRSGVAYHNRYCTDYHQASHELTWPAKGEDFAQFVRCGYTGTAPYARIVWGADPSEDHSAADGLAAAVHQGLSMGASGIGYWGSDIGGFHALFHAERTDVELQSRWLAFGAFSGIMRTQKNGYPRPGPDTYTNDRAEVYDPEVLETYRLLARLRTQLFPEVWEAAQRYQQDGMPMMRHLGLVDPDHEMSWSPETATEFLFGDDLLVAPVVEEGATERDVWLPAGDWVDLWEVLAYDADAQAFVAAGGDPEVLAGHRTVTVAAPLDRIPLFVRAGACLELLDPAVDSLTRLETEGALTTLADAGPTRSICAPAGER